ncbi:hypothetical protein P280DRAFT_70585 [Massarina eburnea CBS 473.64]|uniref:Apple domain-containing protein n=1 Tax=Massarina eburnea CBS 473.64 TaxID=1395130 RepID=A0A6A6RU46_9PLEO|nr:hypothetical protein P280DRAFT_70585 [Massarina eburnea CBS 473.64]
MFVPILLAALTALPAITAQYTVSQSTARVSSTATRCTTRYGFNPLPTGVQGVPTWYSFSATTVTYQVISTSRSTVTVTPDATTFTDVRTTTNIITTTTSSTPSPTTIATSAGFLPLVVVDLASATPIPRIKRLALADHAANEVSHPLKRQTAPGNSGGYIAYPNGTYSGLYRRFAHRVDCNVNVRVNETVTTDVLGAPETKVVPQGTASVLTTLTFTTTTTITEIAPTPTVYAACAGNNVVNHITDINGNTLVFDRVIYRPIEGFPVQNELVVNTTSAVNCCIACQNTPNCAGSFYAGGISECHLRLTQPFTPYPPALPSPSSGTGLPYPSPSAGTLAPYPIPSNGSFFPTASGYVTATASSLVPIGTGTPGNGTGTPGNGTVTPPSNGTCAAGSLSQYLGTIRGQNGNDFPEKYALSFSNGPCGRFSVSPIPVPFEWPGPVKVKRDGIAAA